MRDLTPWIGENWNMVGALFAQFAPAMSRLINWRNPAQHFPVRHHNFGLCVQRNSAMGFGGIYFGKAEQVQAAHSVGHKPCFEAVR